MSLKYNVRLIFFIIVNLLAVPVVAQDDDLDMLPNTLDSEPNLVDRDKDGLWDGWEFHEKIVGLGVNLPDAQIDVPDIYVEIDWFRGVEADAAYFNEIKLEINKVVAAFALPRNGLPNGIRLHIEWDQSLAGNPTISASTYPVLDDWTEIVKENFGSEKTLTHRHALLVLGLKPPLIGRPFSGLAKLPGLGQSFVVSTTKRDSGRTFRRSPNEVALIFMHELGHTLGLSHGGIYQETDDYPNNAWRFLTKVDHQEDKPNHFSVMNYTWASPTQGGVVRRISTPPYTRAVYDFQDFDMPALDERALDERVGLRVPTSGTPPEVLGLNTFVKESSSSYRFMPIEGGIDWNGDGDTVDSRVSMDINDQGAFLTRKTKLRRTLREWNRLRYPVGNIGSRSHLYTFEGFGESNTELGPSPSATHSIVDGVALARDPSSGFSSTGEVIPLALPVVLREERTFGGREYARITEVTSPGAMGPTRTWWTARSNLGSSKEFDPSHAPSRLVVLDGFSGLERTMAMIYNTRGRYIETQASRLNVDASALAGIIYKETNGRAYNRDGTPIVRFETHWFYNLWGKDNQTQFDRHFKPRRYDGFIQYFRRTSTDPWVSFHGNQELEHEVLSFARGLAREEANKSISTGLGQVMGFNHARAGFSSATEMYENFNASVEQQLNGMIGFIENGNCLQALRDRNYRELGRCYNGSAVSENYIRVTEQAAAAYERVVRSAQ